MLSVASVSAGDASGVKVPESVDFDWVESNGVLHSNFLKELKGAVLFVVDVDDLPSSNLLRDGLPERKFLVLSGSTEETDVLDDVVGVESVEGFERLLDDLRAHGEADEGDGLGGEDLARGEVEAEVFAGERGFVEDLVEVGVDLAASLDDRDGPLGALKHSFQALALEDLLCGRQLARLLARPDLHARPRWPLQREQRHALQALPLQVLHQALPLRLPVPVLGRVPRNRQDHVLTEVRVAVLWVH